MPKNTFPTTIEIVRDLFSHMDTKSQLSDTDSKHLDGSSNKLGSVDISKWQPDKSTSEGNHIFIALL